MPGGGSAAVRPMNAPAQRSAPPRLALPSATASFEVDPLGDRIP
jgi:hypothetical protein